jgi:hypothetical protein
LQSYVGPPHISLESLNLLDLRLRIGFPQAYTIVTIRHFVT